jgi:alpha-pyrone synthase
MAALMTEAYLNRVAAAVPDHDVHRKFVDFVPSLISDQRKLALFNRMADRAQIEHRYSFLKPHPQPAGLDCENFYRRGDFPDTAERMRFYERHAFTLAQRALDELGFAKIKDSVKHLIVTTCTGFYAPGIDFQIVEHYGLKSSVERAIIGFMGCYAAFNALKLARHIVRSEPAAKVVILNIELCTLHLKETGDLEQLLSFLIFADGCAASLVSAEASGIELQSFHSTVMPDSSEQITWHIGNLGFDMVLTGRVPKTISAGLLANQDAILGGHRPQDVRHWAIHPGGRTIIDAVRDGIGLSEELLRPSREVLRQFGNMSSASIMFVLKELMQPGIPAGQGCAMAFGPGVTVESLLFRTAGR